MGEAKVLFDRLDQTGDQEIHYSEFLAAAMQSRLLQREGAMEEAFQRFDCDNSGFITVENLREVLGDEYNGEQVEDIIKAADFKKNGVIEYDEFVQASRKESTYPWTRSSQEVTRTTACDPSARRCR